MTIFLVSGPPGNGKSLYAIRKASLALEEGKVVAGNVDLRPDFARYIVRRSPFWWLRPIRARRFIRNARDRFHFSESLAELASIRLGGNPREEGRGVLILDEAHNWMNARSWTAEDRKEIVRLMSQHRKLGWDIYLIAQHPEMIDKQVRNLVEHNIFLRNLKRARVFGLPIFPVNLFLAIWVWHGTAARTIEKREAFLLTWRKSLYDSYATTHGLEGGELEDEYLWLPSPPEDRTPHGTGRTDARRPAPRGRAPRGAGSPDPLEARGPTEQLLQEEDAVEVAGEEQDPSVDLSRPL